MSMDNNLTLILDRRNFSIKDDIGNASNTTSNKDADENNFGQHNITAIVVLTLIYGLLSLTACVGNLLVIWIIGKYLFVYFCSLSVFRLKYSKSLLKLVLYFKYFLVVFPKRKYIQPQNEIYWCEKVFWWNSLKISKESITVKMNV